MVPDMAVTAKPVKAFPKAPPRTLGNNFIERVNHWRVAALPQRWPACRGDVRGGRLHPDVVQDVADFGAVGDEGNDAHLPTAHGAQQRKCLVDAGNQHRPQVMRRSLRACFRFGCGCGRVARRRHPRYARARLCSLHRGWLRRSRLSQRRYRRSQRRVWCQHTKVAVPVGAWRRHPKHPSWLCFGLNLNLLNPYCFDLAAHQVQTSGKDQ